MPDEPTRRAGLSTRHWGLLVLGVILVLTAGLRLWGLYQPFEVDENKLVAPAVGLLHRQPDDAWYPRGARYPHAAYYAHAAVFAAVRWLLPAVSSNFTFIARTFQVVQAVLTGALVFAIGQRLGGLRVGLLAAGFFAVVPLHVKYTHFAHVDLLVTLVMLAVAWAAVRLWDDQRPRWYVAVGLLTGVAAVTQYYGILAAGLLPLAHARHVARAVGHRIRACVRPAFLFGCASIPLGAFLASPYVFLRWQESWEKYQTLSRRAAGGDLGYTSTNLFWPLVTRSPDWGMAFTVGGVAWEFTWPLVILALLGLAAAMRRRQGEVLALLAGWSGAAYLIMAWYVRMHAVKRLLFVTPLVAILAALGVQAIARWGGTRRGGRVASTVAVLVTLGVMLWSVAGFDAAHARGNTHPRAAAWAAANLPAGSVVLQHGPLRLLDGGEGSAHRVVGMAEEYANIGGRHDRRVADHRARSLDDWVAREKVDFVALDSRMVDRYYEPTSRQLFPEMTASYRAFFDEVRNRGELAYKIEPQFWKMAGPRMEIYDVRALQPEDASR